MLSNKSSTYNHVDQNIEKLFKEKGFAKALEHRGIDDKKRIQNFFEACFKDGFSLRPHHMSSDRSRYLNYNEDNNTFAFNVRGAQFILTMSELNALSKIYESNYSGDRIDLNDFAAKCARHPQLVKFGAELAQNLGKQQVEANEAAEPKIAGATSVGKDMLSSSIKGSNKFTVWFLAILFGTGGTVAMTTDTKNPEKANNTSQEQQAINKNKDNVIKMKEGKAVKSINAVKNLTE